MNLSYTKTIETELKGITAVASGAQSISSTLTVNSELSARVFIDFGLDSATTPVGTQFLIQTSQKDTGDDTWRSVWETITGITAPAAIATDADEDIGQTEIACGSTVPALRDIIFFKNATITSSEWATVIDRDITGAAEHFNIRDGLTALQEDGTYYTKGEQFVALVDLQGIRRFRVVCNNNYAASSASCVWRCACITTDNLLVSA